MTSIVVIGSVNLDLAATVSRLPEAGETITGAELNRFPGGKGANQALAARRLGADVQLIPLLVLVVITVFLGSARIRPLPKCR